MTAWVGWRRWKIGSCLNAMTADQPKLIVLGRIAGAHGIKGDVLVETFTGNARDIAAYGPLSDQTGQSMFDLRVQRVTPKGVVAHIKGVDDRNGAEALKGLSLYVTREKLSKPEPGAYYHVDLIGLAAVDETGRVLGSVIAVQNYGAGDLLEIALPGTHKSELVPFTRAFAPEIDFEAKRVVVNLPSNENDSPSSLEE